MAKRKPRIPAEMAGVIDVARDRHRQRFCPPRIEIKKRKDGRWDFVSPYAKEDEEKYCVLLYDAFGTRDTETVGYFLDALAKLCPSDWDEAKRLYRPRENDFNALLAIVGSLRPENEAQAAHAAQLVTLHISAMKLGTVVADSYCDSRTAAVLNKTVRAYGDGMERMARLQGKIAPRTIHQTFEVHKHEHVHVEGGAAPFGGQPYGATRSPPIPCAALPSPHPAQNALPAPSAQGSAPLYASRLRAWCRRAIGRAQRQLSPRGMDA